MALEYCRVTENLIPNVIDHLRVSFPDEPLNASVGLCKHDVPCPLLEEHDIKTIKDGYSIMAIDRNKPATKICGVSLNGIAKPEDFQKCDEELQKHENLQYKRIFGLLNDVNKEIDLFAKYQVDKIFEIRILSVDSEYRGKGIGNELFRQSEILAKKDGFKIMKTDATSLFTQKAAERNGFFVEKTVNYHDYKDEHGRKIYDTEAPHLYYKVMVKCVDS